MENIHATGYLVSGSAKVMLGTIAVVYLANQEIVCSGSPNRMSLEIYTATNINYSDSALRQLRH